MLGLSVGLLSDVLYFALLAHFVASVISMITKSHVVNGYFNWLRSVVNWIALNVFRAKNADCKNGAESKLSNYELENRKLRRQLATAESLLSHKTYELKEVNESLSRLREKISKARAAAKKKVIRPRVNKE